MACGRLFRKIVSKTSMAQPGLPLSADGTALGKTRVTDAVKHLVHATGGNMDSVSAISLRRGGISASLATDVRNEVRQAHGRWWQINGADPYKDLSLNMLLDFTRGLYDQMTA